MLLLLLLVLELLLLVLVLLLLHNFLTRLSGFLLFGLLGLILN